MKLGQFTQEELNVILTKSKTEKFQAWTKYILKYGRQRTLMTYFFNFTTLYIKRIQLRTKGCILPFPQKGDLGITKNYRGITLTPIAAKVYNTLLLKCIEPEVKKIL